MSIITITTDFGLKDWYVACMKGVILSINPKATIVDICHEIPAQDINSAAYIISNASYFPINTVHVVVVDPEVGSSRLPLIVLLSNSQIYVFPNNGLLTYLLQKYSIVKAFVIENQEFMLGNKSSTFHGRDVFAPVAAFASLGVELDRFGPEITEIVSLPIHPLQIEAKHITGQVVYTDIFGNVLTNIHKSQINSNILSCEIAGVVIEDIGEKYCDVESYKIIVIFSSEGYVEVSVNKGNAAKRLNCEVGAEVRVNLA
jgi:S-adenosyl-L-methionine hydrolase (adenosine-forming)